MAIIAQVSNLELVLLELQKDDVTASSFFLLHGVARGGTIGKSVAGRLWGQAIKFVHPLLS